MIVGTTLSHVQPCLIAISQKPATENFGGITKLPPCTSGASIVTANALM